MKMMKMKNLIIIKLNSLQNQKMNQIIKKIQIYPKKIIIIKLQKIILKLTKKIKMK